jgi:hypothetical protein
MEKLVVYIHKTARSGCTGVGRLSTGSSRDFDSDVRL